MSFSNTSPLNRINNILAEARAIRFAAARGVITYEEGKAKTEDLLKIVNEVGKAIAKRYGRTYRNIKFSDL